MNKKQVLKFPKGIIIEIVGNVASGKTTIAKQIESFSNFKYIDVDLFENNPFLTFYPQNPSKWAFITGLHFSYQRGLHTLSVTNYAEKFPLILDQGFDMGLHVYSKDAFVQKEMIGEEWRFLQKLHVDFMKNAPPITTTIFLDIPLPVLMSRIQQRGRNHEQYYSQRYVAQLNKRLIEFKEYLIKGKKRKSVIIYSPLKKSVRVEGKNHKKLVDLLQILWKK